MAELSTASWSLRMARPWLAAMCIMLCAACDRSPPAAPDASPQASRASGTPSARSLPAGEGRDPGAAAPDAGSDKEVMQAEGVFTGTLYCGGCADSDAVAATLHLHADGGFDLVERQHGEPEDVRHSGTWFASEDGRAILLADEDGHGGHHVFEWQGEDTLRLLSDQPLDHEAPVLLVRTD